MFKQLFYQQRHQRRPLIGSSAHLRSIARLGIETMEARTLLSADALDIVPHNDHAEAPTVVIQRVQVTNNYEGGFILGTFSNAGTDHDVLSRLRNQISDATLQELISRGSQNSPGATGTYQLFDPGLQPAVIHIDAEAAANPKINLPFAGDLRGEGGSIPIAPILAKVGALDATRRIGSATLTTSDLLVHASQPTDKDPASTSSTESLSAEWARALVFELAGGEPDADSRQEQAIDRSMQGGNPNGGQTLPGSADKADTASNQPHNPRVMVDELILADVASNDAKHVLAMKQPTDASVEQVDQFPASDKTSSADAPNAFDVTDAAYREVFADWNSREKGSFQWLNSYTRPAVGASPILMVLALEQIANRKSRRQVQNPPTKFTPRLNRE